MLGETQTWDEGIHLASGYAYLRTGDYRLSPEHPPLGRILNALPLFLFPLSFDPARMVPPMNEAGQHFIYHNRISPFLLLNSARTVTVLLTIVFAVWVAFWTRKHLGSIAALIATALLVFDPSIVAHGHYVTTDLIAAFTIFLAVTLWIDDYLNPTVSGLLLAGLALGAALSSKYSALFLLPVLAVAGVAALRVRRTIVFLVIAASVICLVSAPEFVHARGGSLEAELKGQGIGGMTLKWAAHHLHLPRMNYLIGIDRLFEQNVVGEQGYLLGKLSDHGWWYYFPIAFLVKTPAATLFALVTALVVSARAAGGQLVRTAMVIVPVLFFVLCCWSGITIGQRHILPVYAFLFVAVGSVLASYPKTAVVIVSLLVCESLAIYPHYLSFFNLPSGGPGNGARYLVDSNLDWGQDLGILGRYMDERGLRQVCLAYFGNVDPLRYGVEYTRLPSTAADADCVAAVSATPLYGLYADHDEYAWLRKMKPLGKIGYSIYLFDLRKNTQARAVLP